MKNIFIKSGGVDYRVVIKDDGEAYIDDKKIDGLSEILQNASHSISPSIPAQQTKESVDILKTALIASSTNRNAAAICAASVACF